MGCPMMDKKKAVETVTEYPYEALYRPWSWILSSFSNLIIFAVLVGFAYFYYKTQKRRKRPSVTYRTIQMREAAPEENKITALVTGGNGLLGREIVKSLIADGGYLIYSLDLLLPTEEERNGGVYTYIQADITNIDDLIIAFKGVDTVFHCAGITPNSIRHSSKDFYQVNVSGTENVIKACTECQVKRLVYTSSASVTLSKDPKTVSVDCDESYPLPSDPLNPYIGSKGSAEKLVRAANGKEGLLTCVLRPNGFIESIFAGIEKNLYNFDGADFEFSLVSVHSAAEAHVLAEKKLVQDGGESVVAGKAYNINDQKTSLKEIADFVASEKSISPMYLPFSIIRFLAKVNETVYWLTGFVAISESLTTMNTDLKTHTYTCDLARQELGWGLSPPWKEVVKNLLKNKDQSKKEQ